jgi:hypothetical protein
VSPRTLLLALVSACAGAPDTVAGCAALADAAAQEDCRYRLVGPLVGDTTKLSAALAEVRASASPQSHDLLLLRLAIDAPAQAGALCQQVQTEGAREKCQQVLGRPHLGTTRRPPTADGGPPPPASPAP